MKYKNAAHLWHQNRYRSRGHNLYWDPAATHANRVWRQLTRPRTLARIGLTWTESRFGLFFYLSLQALRNL